jgi:hypothetical protein
VTLLKSGGMTDEEKETFRKCWPSLRDMFGKSFLSIPYEQCVQFEADVLWEYQRAIGLVPPPEKQLVAPAGTIEVFLSYSHRDEQHRKSLIAHLAQLKNEGKIRDWHDRMIGAGTEWKGQIMGHLESAQIVLLLVSADFLASSFCYSIEMKRAVERHDVGEARVIPIILRSCDWQTAPFGKLQALPKDAKAVTSWSNKDEALTNVAKGIRAAVNDIIPKSADGSS